MTQYIDKDMLLKAIEVKRNGLIALMNQIPYASNYPIWSSNVDLLDEVKRGIDILEVKEVDLDKELEDWLGERVGKWTGKECERMCRYFFELGLKTQKGE